MRRWMSIPVAAVVLTACVTINVYFPAAEAREAAREFVENVIGNDVQPSTPVDDDSGGPSAAVTPDMRRYAIDWYSLVGINSAHAQARPNITLKTPAIQAIQSRMAARFNAQLRVGFDTGALGIASDGAIVMRDAAKLALRDRVAVNQAVADHNRDRKALYREVAVANGHPEWEAQIREVFARQWIDSARAGWWYQSGGSWRQK